MTRAAWAGRRDARRGAGHTGRAQPAPRPQGVLAPPEASGVDLRRALEALHQQARAPRRLGPRLRRAAAPSPCRPRLRLPRRARERCVAARTGGGARCHSLPRCRHSTASRSTSSHCAWACGTAARASGASALSPSPSASRAAPRGPRGSRGAARARACPPRRSRRPAPLQTKGRRPPRPLRPAAGPDGRSAARSGSGTPLPSY